MSSSGKKIDPSDLLREKHSSRASSAGEGGVRPEDDERTVDELLAERDTLEDEAVQSTRNALATIHTTREVGQETLMTLKAQGEQLSSTEERIAQADANAQLNYSKAKKVKKYGNLFNLSWAFSSRKKAELDRQYEAELGRISGEEARAAEKDRQRAVQQQDRAGARQMHEALEQQGDQPASSLPEDPAAGSARAREIDRNLDEISRTAKSLTRMAEDMGQELNEQTVSIDRIAATGSHVEGTLERSAKKIEKYS